MLHHGGAGGRAGGRLGCLAVGELGGLRLRGEPADGGGGGGGGGSSGGGGGGGGDGGGDGSSSSGGGATVSSRVAAIPGQKAQRWAWGVGSRVLGGGALSLTAPLAPVYSQ